MIDPKPGQAGAAVVCSFILVGIYHGTKSDISLRTQSSRPINRQASFGYEKSSEAPKHTGLDSPYRYDCNEVECTPLDDYVWRDNKDFRKGTRR